MSEKVLDIDLVREFIKVQTCSKMMPPFIDERRNNTPLMDETKNDDPYQNCNPGHADT